MAINLAKNIAGAGVLSLSAGIASFSGAKAAVLPATLLLLFLGAVSAYSFSLLARVGEDNGTATIRETWSKLFGEKWAYSTGTTAAGESALYCKDPDANELMFVEDAAIEPIAEADDGPMVPWTRLW